MKKLILLTALVAILAIVYFAPVEEWLSDIGKNEDSLVREAEEKLFGMSLSTTTAAEKDSEIGRSFFNTAVGAAIATTSVDVSSCVPNHRVIQVAYGDRIAFNNVADASVALHFRNLGEKTIPSGGTFFLDAAETIEGERRFGSANVSSYRCGRSPEPAGFIVVFD